MAGVRRHQSAAVPQSTPPKQIIPSHIQTRVQPQPEPKPKTPLEEFEASLGIRTTLMIKNIPVKYTQEMLLDLLDNKLGFVRKYDFVYLPIDFRNRCSMCYAFVNFVTSNEADRFREMVHQRIFPESNAPCEVAWARVQGFHANVEHYRNSPINGIPIDEYKPKIFLGGQACPFPAPDGAIPKIQLRPARRQR